MECAVPTVDAAVDESHSQTAEMESFVVAVAVEEVWVGRRGRQMEEVPENGSHLKRKQRRRSWEEEGNENLDTETQFLLHRGLRHSPNHSYYWKEVEDILVAVEDIKTRRRIDLEVVEEEDIHQSLLPYSAAAAAVVGRRV